MVNRRTQGGGQRNWVLQSRAMGWGHGRAAIPSPPLRRGAGDGGQPHAPTSRCAGLPHPAAVVLATTRAMELGGLLRCSGKGGHARADRQRPVRTVSYATSSGGNIARPGGRLPHRALPREGTAGTEVALHAARARLRLARLHEYGRWCLIRAVTPRPNSLEVYSCLSAPRAATRRSALRSRARCGRASMPCLWGLLAIGCGQAWPSTCRALTGSRSAPPCSAALLNTILRNDTFFFSQPAPSWSARQHRPHPSGRKYYVLLPHNELVGGQRDRQRAVGAHFGASPQLPLG